MNPSKPVALVELVTHTSRCVNGENVVQRKREWVRSDDPRLPPACGYKIDYGPTPEINQPAKEINKSAEENSPLPSTQPRAAVPQADTVEGSCATEPKSTEPKSEEVASARSSITQTSVEKPSVEQTSVAPTTIALASVAQTTAQSLARLLAKLSIPKKEPQQEVKMSSDELNEEDYYEDDAADVDEQEDDDRPWPITKRTLTEIDDMSPTELEDLIENVDDHERWQDLREDAKRRTSQWLSGIKKAEEAPRCQFAKVNGRGCGSPAMKGKTLCYYHAEAQAKREAEEARKLELPTLEDRVSVQLAVVRVCNHLVEKSIDEKTGRAIISALRLAYRNLGDQDSLL